MYQPLAVVVPHRKIGIEVAHGYFLLLINLFLLMSCLKLLLMVRFVCVEGSPRQIRNSVIIKPLLLLQLLVHFLDHVNLGLKLDWHNLLCFYLCDHIWGVVSLAPHLLLVKFACHVGVVHQVIRSIRLLLVAHLGLRYVCVLENVTLTRWTYVILPGLVDALVNRRHRARGLSKCWLVTEEVRFGAHAVRRRTFFALLFALNEHRHRAEE